MPMRSPLAQVPMVFPPRFRGGRQQFVVDEGLQRVTERVLGINSPRESSLAKLDGSRKGLRSFRSAIGEGKVCVLVPRPTSSRRFCERRSYFATIRSQTLFGCLPASSSSACRFSDRGGSVFPSVPTDSLSFLDLACKLLILWWAQQDSNLRLPPCEGVLKVDG
jgi:hypothetical protein